MNDSSYGRNSIFRALFGVYIAAARAPPSKSIFACARRVTCTSATSPLLSLRSFFFLFLFFFFFFFFIFRRISELRSTRALCARSCPSAPASDTRKREAQNLWSFNKIINLSPE